jgi:hypothetical protein
MVNGQTAILNLAERVAQSASSKKNNNLQAESSAFPAGPRGQPFDGW